VVLLPHRQTPTDVYACIYEVGRNKRKKSEILFWVGYSVRSRRVVSLHDAHTHTPLMTLVSSKMIWAAGSSNSLHTHAYTHDGSGREVPRVVARSEAYWAGGTGGGGMRRGDVVRGLRSEVKTYPFSPRFARLRSIQPQPPRCQLSQCYARFAETRSLQKCVYIII